MDILFALEIFEFNLNDLAERIIEKPQLMVMVNDFF